MCGARSETSGHRQTDGMYILSAAVEHTHLSSGKDLHSRFLHGLFQQLVRLQSTKYQDKFDRLHANA
jgi:hypothetical protein